MLAGEFLDPDEEMASYRLPDPGLTDGLPSLGLPSDPWLEPINLDLEPIDAAFMDDAD